MNTGELTSDTLESFRNSFAKGPKNAFAQNVVARSDPLETCLQRKTLETSNHIYSHKVDEVKPVTNQKSSGRCWIFATLNAMRIPFMKDRNIEDFEFSQGYLFFWDKVERSNYFLNTIADSYCREPKEDVGGRLVSFLLGNPICDGGQWDMVVNLIEKHGVMPKKCYPETWSCESSMRMNSILKSKLREFAHDIHKHIDAGNDKASVKELIREQMNTIFRIVSICLGSPPKEFVWEYYDKSKQYHKVENISPLDFYRNHVKPHFDAGSKVCLVADPRPENPTGKTYTVDCLGNMVGGRKTIYNNQPVETLVDIAAKSIQAGEPVWFGCEVGKHMASKQGILDLDVVDYEMVFDTKVNLNLRKADRLIYGDSEMNHAMVLTGVHVEGSEHVPNGGTTNGYDNKSTGKIKKWRIENSWGEDRNEKGFITMTTEWFHEFVFEIVVDRKFCSKEILDVFELEPKVLPAWDPMGALAR